MAHLEKDIASSLPEGTSLLSELGSSVTKVHNICKNLRERIQNESFSTDKGVSLLELKNQLFLNYLSNHLHTTLLKVSGVKLEGNSAIDNLVELRVALERLRPLEDKLKFQIQKYIKLATEVPKESAEPEVTNRLDNIEDSTSEDNAASSDEENDDNEATRLYRIPKISQKHYPGEEKSADSRQKRERARALSSAMVRDALEEHGDDPEVLHNMDTLKRKSIEKRKEIQRYEEDNFTRLTLSKKDKAALHQMSTQGNISKELLSFRSLEFGTDASGKNSSSKKRKMAPGKNKKRKKGGGGFKKRKKH